MPQLKAQVAAATAERVKAEARAVNAEQATEAALAAAAAAVKKRSATTGETTRRTVESSGSEDEFEMLEGNPWRHRELSTQVGVARLHAAV